jgi:hypothetical protein
MPSSSPTNRPELLLALLDSPKHSADVGLRITSSDLKDRVHLPVKMPYLCKGISKGISKGDMTKPARNLDLPGTASKVGGQR